MTNLSLQMPANDGVPRKPPQTVSNMGTQVEQFLEHCPWEKKAMDELGETPERRDACLREFRNRVEDIDEFKPYLDESFLLGFLRIRKFDVDRAVKSYKKFFKMRLFNPNKYFPMGEGTRELRDKYNLGVGTVLRKRNPIDKTAVLILRVGDWSPDTGYDLSDLFTPVALTILVYGMDDTSQVHGLRVILDLRGLHMGHLRCFPLSAIRALIYIITDAFPVRFKGFHVLQDHVFFDYLFALTRPFLTRKIQKRLHLHGQDALALHDHICPSILPEEYGGDDGPFRWDYLTDPLYKIHDKMVEFSYFGYDTRDNCKKY